MNEPTNEQLAEAADRIAHHFESRGYAHGKHVADARAAKLIASRLRSPGEGLSPDDRLKRELFAEALEPFALACMSADDDSVKDTSNAWESSMAMAVTYGDFRRARAALASTPVLSSGSASGTVGEGDVEAFDLIAHIHRARAFSEKTFGPGGNPTRPLNHIRKEVEEIAAELAAEADRAQGWEDTTCLRGLIQRLADALSSLSGGAGGGFCTSVEAAEPENSAPQASAPSAVWRDMNSAPKDGAAILACSTNHDAVEVVCWQDGLPSGSIDAIVSGEAEEGWVNRGRIKDRFYANPRWFTHWMPLPAPPEDGSQTPLASDGDVQRSGTTEPKPLTKTKERT